MPGSDICTGSSKMYNCIMLAFASECVYRQGVIVQDDQSQQQLPPQLHVTRLAPLCSVQHSYDTETLLEGGGRTGR